MTNAETVKNRKKKKEIPPALKIMLGFALLIAAGTILLSFPFSKKAELSFIDIFFTATSAVCVAGISVVNIASSFTLFGQIVILLLIQFGGLGFMTITTLIFIVVGKKITLKERVALSEAYNEDSLQGLVKLTRTIVFYTLIIEACGAVLLSFVFIPDFGALKGIYYSVFHSVSAFCNAGIDIIEGGGTYPYVTNVLFNLSIMLLIFLGGIGFAVMRDVVKNKLPRKFSFNTKVVLSISFFLILLSTILYLLCEWQNESTFGGDTFGQKLLSSMFQAVTTRTAGFETIPQGSFTGASKLLTMLNMFIGTSPGSMGGGLKTTTFFLIFVYFINGIKGRQSGFTAFGKSYADKFVQKSLLLLIYSLSALAVFTLLLLIFEHGSGLGPEALLFEAVSAFATVGLSFGITAELSAASQILLVFIMFIGRLGAPVLGLFYMLSHNKDDYHIRYPEAKIIVG